MENHIDVLSELKQLGIKTEYGDKVNTLDILKTILGLYAFIGDKRIELRKKELKKLEYFIFLNSGMAKKK